jgi:hypothetical protein
MPEDTEEKPEESNGKNSKAVIAVWVGKHLGIPSVVIVALMTLVQSWWDGKQEEYESYKNSVNDLEKKVQVLEAQKATDQAQWRAIQRVDQKASEVEVTTKANELVLDKFISDKLIQHRMAEKADQEQTILDKVLGKKKPPPPLIIRRNSKKPKTLEQYRDEQVQEHQQEQMQMQQQLKLK